MSKLSKIAIISLSVGISVGGFSIFSFNFPINISGNVDKDKSTAEITKASESSSEMEAHASLEGVDISGKTNVKGVLKDENDSITYTYTPTVSGHFAFNIDTNHSIDMVAYDEDNLELEHQDNSGRCLECELKKGKNYAIKLTPKEFSSEQKQASYEIAVGVPEKNKHIELNTLPKTVTGRIKYFGQQINYTFIAPKSAWYQIDAEVPISFQLDVLDSDGINLYASLGSAFVKLKANEKYTLRISDFIFGEFKPCDFKIHFNYDDDY